MRRGAELGVAVPLNAALCDLVRAVETGAEQRPALLEPLLELATAAPR